MMTDAPLKKRTPNRQIEQPVIAPSVIPQTNKINTNNNHHIQYNPRPNPLENSPIPQSMPMPMPMPSKDMMFLRKQKLKELLDEEVEEYKFELVSRNKNNYSGITDQSVNMKPQLFNQHPQSQSQSRPTSIQSQAFYTQSNGTPRNNYASSYYPEPQPNHYSKYIYENNNNNKPIRDAYADNRCNKISSREFNVNKELDYAIKKYADNLDKLKVDEFMSRKKIQDDLLQKINSKLTKINHEMNDKIYQEDIAEQWANKHPRQDMNDNGSNSGNGKPISTHTPNRYSYI